MLLSINNATMAENGDDGQMMIVLLLGVVVMMCVSSCCSSLLTAYANECDTDGMFSMFAGDWYWNLVPSPGVLGCTAGGTTDASATVNTVEQIVENKSNQPTTSGESTDSKCDIGTEANYEYRVREKNSSGEWKCPNGWTDTKCGLVSNADGKWVDGDETGAKQCIKPKSGKTGSSNNGTSSANCITIFSDYNYDKTNRPKGEHTLCINSGNSEMKIPNLKNVKSGRHHWNDRISHVSVPQGITLSLWDNEKWTGKQTEHIVGPVNRKSLREIKYKNGQGGNINAEATTLHFWKNNDASSASTPTTSTSSTGGCNYNSKSDKVWVFENDKYKGNCQSFGNGNHNLALKSVGSLKIPKKSKRRVKLCQEYSQGGSCKYFVKDTPKMFSSHKNAKSVKVYK